MNNQYTTSLIDGATKPILSINTYRALNSFYIGIKSVLGSILANVHAKGLMILTGKVAIATKG